MNFEILDHTADVCVRVSAKSFQKLLENAAKAMMNLIANTDLIRPTKSISINVNGENQEELLVKWLQEILYRMEVKKMLFKDFKITRFAENKVSGGAFGEKIDLKKHILLHQIKGVTHHNLKIKKARDKLTADIVFDI